MNENLHPGQFSGATQGYRYDKNVHLLHPDDNRYERDPGQMTLPGMGNSFGLDNRFHPDVVEYGQSAKERAHDPLKWSGQQAFRGMPKPSDPSLHRLRQANPNLNDYQFKVSGTRVTARDAAGKRVGKLELGYDRIPELFEPHEHPNHREIESIGVAPDHQGRGLGEAMYDLARAHGLNPLHSTERSESGEAFARRVGGPALPRKKGHGMDFYLGLPGFAPRDHV